MEKKDFKRKRSDNWNEADKLLLRELIRERVYEIENKNTDTNTNHEKKKAWLAVQESFNASCTGGQRTIIQLKSQWTSTKVAARKRRKEYSKAEGGEAPLEVSLSSSDINVWLPNEFVVDSNEFDSDVFLDERIEIGDEEYTPPAKYEMEHEQHTPNEDKIPENIQTPSPSFEKKMPTKRKNRTDDSIKRLTEFDIKCRKEIHELQIEAEKKRIRNLDREHDLIEAKIKLKVLSFLNVLMK